MNKAEHTVRELGALPHVKWDNPDGPLLICKNGTVHWLTFIERLCLWLRLTSVEELDAKYNKELTCG